jgi:hypothetical protein
MQVRSVPQIAPLLFLSPVSLRPLSPVSHLASQLEPKPAEASSPGDVRWWPGQPPVTTWRQWGCSPVAWRSHGLGRRGPPTARGGGPGWRQKLPRRPLLQICVVAAGGATRWKSCPRPAGLGAGRRCCADEWSRGGHAVFASAAAVSCLRSRACLSSRRIAEAEVASGVGMRMKKRICMTCGTH